MTADVFEVSALIIEIIVWPACIFKPWPDPGLMEKIGQKWATIREKSKRWDISYEKDNYSNRRS